MYLNRWHGWCHVKLQPSRRKSCVHHTTCHFMQSHIRGTLWTRKVLCGSFLCAIYKILFIRKVYACLAVTCHLHFWQNDRDLLHASAVTRGWNGYWNKSQHKKSTMEKKILLPLQQGIEPTTFQSRVWRSNHWAIPASVHLPHFSCCFYTTGSFWSMV